MQNIQNAAEIQQRVINLVELYRTKVGVESQTSKELAEEYKAQYDNQIDIAYSLHEQGIEDYVFDIHLPEDAVDQIRANEQLLGYFYKNIAGKDANQKVLGYMLAEEYDSSIFTEEEHSFLMNHFAEMVNYIIQTPNNNLKAIERDGMNDIDLLPKEVLTLIKERVVIPSGSIIYNPFTGFAQLACLYKDCSFFCEETYMPYFKRWNAYCDKVRETEHIVENKVDENKLYAWMTIVLYANSIEARVVEDGTLPAKYDSVMSFIPVIPNAIPDYAYERDFELPHDAETINKILVSYKNLPEGGNMILILPKEYLWANCSYYSLRPLWEEMIKDKSLTEIIQLPRVMSTNLHEDYCMIIAIKGREGSTTTLIDARFAAQKSEKKNFDQILDLSSLKKMLANNGKEAVTGLRKVVKVSSEELSPDFLIPQVYVIERPSEAEHPVPLSSLCSLLSAKVRDVQFDLPEETPWVTMSDLTPLYTGDLDMSCIRKADCPNNPPYVEGSKEYGFDKDGKFVDSIWEQTGKSKGHHVLDYRRCTYLDGNSDAVLYEQSVESGVQIAVVHATGKPYAVSSGILVFCPRDDFDANSLAALLRLSIVHRQLIAYQEYGLGNHQNDILVPTDKRIISDELYRMKREESVTKELGDKVQAMKTEYINEVRMRKHDMGQYIFELMNIEDNMRFFLNNRETEKDYCSQIGTLLDNLKSSLGELSTMLDNLSKEEQFGEPESLDIQDFMSNLEKRHLADGFAISYSFDKKTLMSYRLKQAAISDLFLEELISNSQMETVASNLQLEYDKKQAKQDVLAQRMLIEEGIKQKQKEDAANDYLIKNSMANTMRDLFSDNLQLEYDKKQAKQDVLAQRMLTEEDIKQKQKEDAANDYLKKKSMANTKSFLFSDHMPFIYVSSNDFQRLVNNIIDNARKHGFTETNRKDYVMHISTSIDVENDMLIIDFRNNGKPLPEGLNKMRYGIKGEKAGRTGGSGIGGHYVKLFVEHYGGTYDIFMEKGWTVVRICLPIK